jgi:hypothetical protein
MTHYSKRERYSFGRHLVLNGLSLVGLVGVVAIQLPSGGHGIQALSALYGAAPHPGVSSGITWSMVPSVNPGPPTTMSTFSSLSCSGAGSCIAVGGSTYHSGLVANLAESWNGHALSLVPALEPGPSIDLSNVSCVASDLCRVLGFTANASVVFGTWRNRNSAKWSLIPGSSNVVIDSLSCPVTTFCTAVGFQKGGIERRTLVESWYGHRWSVVRSPNIGPSRDYYNLNGVSCTSRLFCVAVGTYGLQTGTKLVSSRTLIEIWNGARWTVASSPNRGPSTEFNYLNSVSCYSSDLCIAVGDYSDYGGVIERTLVEHWNGTAWSELSSPNRGGVYDANEFNGVSCPSREQCVAVGDYDTASGVQYRRPLVESWAGSRWALDAGASGGPSSDASLTSVSCATADSCAAVGYVRMEPSEPYQTLLERQATPKLH